MKIERREGGVLGLGWGCCGGWLVGFGWGYREAAGLLGTVVLCRMVRMLDVCVRVWMFRDRVEMRVCAWLCQL